MSEIEKKVGRKRIGQPVSITLTSTQRAWIESQRREGEALTETIRRIINDAKTAYEQHCYAALHYRRM